MSEALVLSGGSAGDTALCLHTALLASGGGQLSLVSRGLVQSLRPSLGLPVSLCLSLPLLSLMETLAWALGLIVI